MRNIFTLFLLTLCSFSYAQQTPAPQQSEAIMITGATVHIGNGQTILSGNVGFENGKITFVGDGRSMQPSDTKNYKIIKADGKHVYPGFIVPSNQLGLVEIDAVRSTNDKREVGNFNPNVRSIIAYNTDSKVTPTIRSNGILLAQISPEGGRISGQSSIVELDAWNWEDAAYKADDAIHLNWPTVFKRRWWRSTAPAAKNDDYDKQTEEINSFFKEAYAYSQTSASVKNLKFEAMRGLFDGSKNLFVHTHGAKEITAAVLMLKKLGVTPVVFGGRDSWMITDFLKQNNISIILRQMHNLPRNPDTDIDQPFKTPAMLAEAGVLFAISADQDHGGLRNLPFQAGHAVGFGLSKEDALKAITSNTAKILKIDKTVGSLETGKDATLFISAGDALDMRTCIVEQAFIRGKEIDLDNKQKALYRKFSNKYKSK